MPIHSLGLSFLILVLAASGPAFAEAPTPPPTPTTTIKLKRGDELPLLLFHAELKGGATRPKALILFESGGGGWSWWEDLVCHKLQTSGYEVIGIDARLYSLTDYTLDILQADFQAIAGLGQKPYGDHPLPLILSGWSSGAEQAVAVAGGPHPPTGLTGLLLFAPGSWGGYGWYTSHDYGPRLSKSKTFALADFSDTIGNVRVAQWHGTYDIFDSRVWLRTLKAPHREFDMADSIHDFGGASDEFLVRMIASIDWILGKEPEPAPSSPPAPAP